MTNRKNPSEGVTEGVSDLEKLGGLEQSETTSNPSPYQQNKPGRGRRRDGTGYPAAPGWKGDLPTGRDAALATAPRSKAVSQRVLEALRLHGPMSPEQVAEVINEHILSTRPRLSQLRACGEVMPTAMRGRTALGRQSIVWRLALPEERSAFQADGEAKQ